MNSPSRLWIGVAATAAVVFAGGGAAPAIAHDTTPAGVASATQHRLTLAEQKDLATQVLDRAVQWLDFLQAKVASDDRLTDQQRATFTARIDAALARIAAAKAAIAAATTRAQVWDALFSAHLPLLAFPRPVARETRHRLADPDKRTPRVSPARTLRAGTDPARPLTDPTRCSHHWAWDPNRDWRDGSWDQHRDWGTGWDGYRFADWYSHR